MFGVAGVKMLYGSFVIALVVGGIFCILSFGVVHGRKAIEPVENVEDIVKRLNHNNFGEHIDMEGKLFKFIFIIALFMKIYEFVNTNLDLV